MSALPAESHPVRRPVRPGAAPMGAGSMGAGRRRPTFGTPAAATRGATARALRPEPTAPPRRHLRPAPAPAVRRRPRLAHAVLTLAGIGVILLGQLALSIALADGTYRISSLQAAQVELERSQNALTEQLDLAGSTQSLIARAAELGMVASGSPVFLDLVAGTATGSAKAAGRGAVGSNLIGNSLLDPADAAAFGAAAEAAESQPLSSTEPQSSTATSGSASSGTETSPSAPSQPGLLPSPTTH